MDSATSQAPGRDFFGTLGVKLYRYRTLVRRQWWILAITIGIGLAYQAWIVFNKPVLFESTSQLNISEQLNVQDMQKFRQQDESFVGTTLNMLRSRDILERARERLALEAPQLSGAMPEITSSVIPRTSIFSVTGTGSNPEYTRRFVDATVSEFIAFKNEQREKTLGIASGGLSDQANRLRKELEHYQAELREFVEKNNMPFWAEQGKRSAEFLAGLKNRQAELETELQRLRNLTPDQLLTAPRPADRGTAPAVRNDGGSQEMGQNNELYAQYLQTTQQLIQKQAELDERSRFWKPKHPRLQAIRADVERLQRLLDVIRQQNRTATVSRIAAIEAELKSLGTSIEGWNQRVMESNVKHAQYQTLEGNVTRTQAFLEKLLTSQSAITTGPVLEPLTVLNPATPPVEVPKRTGKHLAMGFLGGLVIGLVILGVLDRADDRVTSSSEVLEHFSEAIVGQIPNVADSRGESGLPLLQPDDERYTYAEAFRSLRSSLIFMPNQSDLKTLLITSAIPNEGKSTITSNLAITMAAAGARTIVVDADLRRGDLASLFDTDGRTGLSNVLRGEVSWKAAVQSTQFPLLSLIPRGPVTNQTGELLLRPIIETLIHELKSSYDLVIFNTAPILATDDTPTLAPHFDGSLMVMRAQFTSSRLTRNALDALYQRQVNVLGLILNCVDTEMPDYYYYRYPKYYAA